MTFHIPSAQLDCFGETPDKRFGKFKKGDYYARNISSDDI